MRSSTAPNSPTRNLITGGMGFIGGHLARELLDRGQQVTVVDDLSTGRFENIQSLVGYPRFRFAVANIADEIVLDRLISESDVVYHLAAAVGVKLIMDDAVRTIETNVAGTEAVLKAALRYRTKVLVASTSEVYGKGARFPFREDDDVVLGATSHHRWAYAASKMVDEFLALAYFWQKGLPVVIFRLFNTVGPGQTGHYGMVIPRLVQQALSGEGLTVYGDGQQSRCFLHVFDAVRAIVGLAGCPEAVGQVFNVGSTEEVTILELAHRILQRVDPGAANGLHGLLSSKDGSPSRITFVPYAQAYGPGFEDMPRRIPDVSKIHQHIGWQAQLTLDDILRDVIESFAPRQVAVA
ncbi:MAG: GDP-mannose 4,6-dehydratase [Anaerolineae bacterium]